MCYMRFHLKTLPFPSLSSALQCHLHQPETWRRPLHSGTRVPNCAGHHSEGKSPHGWHQFSLSKRVRKVETQMFSLLSKPFHWHLGSCGIFGRGKFFVWHVQPSGWQQHCQVGPVEAAADAGRLRCSTELSTVRRECYQTGRTTVDGTGALWEFA